ncbi:hypothetical protein AB205_0216270, partial [Aquarana catesbeiana]
LKEFQQKTPSAAPAGGKKKKKGKESNSHPDTPNRLSPDPIEAILKGLVSDLHRTNGVSIPTLADMKVSFYLGFWFSAFSSFACAFLLLILLAVCLFVSILHFAFALGTVYHQMTHRLLSK